MKIQINKRVSLEINPDWCDKDIFIADDKYDSIRLTFEEMDTILEAYLKSQNKIAISNIFHEESKTSENGS